MGKAITSASIGVLLTLGVGGMASSAQTGGNTCGTTTEQNDDGDSGRWGLAGLLGLAGLAGLARRDRRDRSDYPGVPLRHSVTII